MEAMEIESMIWCCTYVDLRADVLRVLGMDDQEHAYRFRLRRETSTVFCVSYPYYPICTNDHVRELVSGDCVVLDATPRKRKREEEVIDEDVKPDTNREAMLRRFGKPRAPAVDIQALLDRAPHPLASTPNCCECGEHIFMWMSRRRCQRSRACKELAFCSPDCARAHGHKCQAKPSPPRKPRAKKPKLDAAAAEPKAEAEPVAGPAAGPATCCVCMDARANAILPCQHCVTCDACTARLGGRCPKCRAEFAGAEVRSFRGLFF